MIRLPLLVAALLPIAPTPADPFEQAVVGLRAGLTAHGPAELARAARRLRASGAVPAGGEDDAATRWLRAARGRPPPAERDRALGPGYRSLLLPGGGDIRLEQTFLAGQRARIAVVAAADARWRLVVSDDETVVCRAAPPQRLCDWIPSYTARVRIELRNAGARPARYYLVAQ